MSDYGDSVGGRGVVVLPSNTSLILADSRFRENADIEEPADFICNVSSAIAVKEIYYRLLAWNQPIYAHNNTNSEVRFQLSDDPFTPVSPEVFVCYAAPFQSFRDLDGNPPGSVFQVPQGYSYAFQMETAFNYDARLLSSNMTPIPGGGHPYTDSTLADTVYITFRYNPARGFAIQAFRYDYATDTFGVPIAIVLLDCSWIRLAHYVHGFGVNDPTTGVFVPQAQGPQYAITCNDTPNLMPSRYVVVQSPELTKDRRTPSFHSSQLSGFANEIAILPLLMENICVFHTNEVGDDSTVVSLRAAYEPNRFRITMKDEHGEILNCDDPVGKMLDTPGFLTPDDANSLLNSATTNRYRGRGNTNVVNYLTFGRTYNIIAPGGKPRILWRSTPYYLSGYQGSSSFLTDGGSYFEKGPADPPYIGTHWCDTATQTAVPATNYYAANLGIQPIAYVGASPTNPPQLSAIYLWNPVLNPNPQMGFDITVSVNITSNTAFSDPKVTAIPIMAHPSENRVYGIWNFPRLLDTFLVPNTKSWSAGQFNGFIANPKYIATGFFNQTNIPFRVCVGIFWNNGAPFDSTASIDQFTVYGRNIFDADNNIQFGGPFTTVQSAYVPPVIEKQTSSGYPFGNPICKMLCEDVLHELTGVLEYN